MKSKPSSPSSKPRAAKPPSAVQRPGRGIPRVLELALVARAAGRCEFKGCNLFLFNHHLTGRSGNFAQRAHIVAFSSGGPRGRKKMRPADLNKIANLMLLCAGCHKVVDDHPKEHPVSFLKGWKRAHESRIKAVTSAGPEMQTTIIQLRGVIAGQHVDIPAGDVRQAILPRFPAGHEDEHVIDISGISSESPEIFAAARREIQRCLRPILQGGLESTGPRHYSVFALAPIPTLVALGYELGDKIRVDLYQRHRDTESWKWKVDGPELEFVAAKLSDGTDPSRVALLLSVSGRVTMEDLPPDLATAASCYQITPTACEPGLSILRRREDLSAFKGIYRRLLADLHALHPGMRELHLFPAIPAPIAVACGRELLPKIAPEIVVHDLVRGTFFEKLRINRKEDII